MALRASLAEPHSSRRGKPLRLRRLGPSRPRQTDGSAPRRLGPHPGQASVSCLVLSVLPRPLSAPRTHVLFCLSSPPRLTHEGRSALLKRKRRPVQHEHMLNRAPGPPRIASTPKGDAFGVEKGCLQQRTVSPTVPITGRAHGGTFRCRSRLRTRP